MSNELKKDSCDFIESIKLIYYYIQGMIYCEMQKYEKAIANFNKCIELDSKEASYYYVRAEVYYKTEEYEKALADFNKDKELNSNETQNNCCLNKPYIEKWKSMMEQLQIFIKR